MRRPGSDRIKISGLATVSSCSLEPTRNRTPVTRACRQKLTGVCDARAMQFMIAKNKSKLAFGVYMKGAEPFGVR